MFEKVPELERIGAVSGGTGESTVSDERSLKDLESCMDEPETDEDIDSLGPSRSASEGRNLKPSDSVRSWTGIARRNIVVLLGYCPGSCLILDMARTATEWGLRQRRDLSEAA